MLEAAWRLGAWELERDEKRGCDHAGASDIEAAECPQAFANPRLSIDDGWVAEAPDQDELMRLGARVGYVRWLFRPVQSGIWGQTSHDDTVGDGGGSASNRLPTFCWRQQCDGNGGAEGVAVDS